MDKLQDLILSLIGGEKMGLIDWSEPSLLSSNSLLITLEQADQSTVSAAMIAFNPIFWK